jgi:uncharacterized protein YdaU (DUF1376 family)
MSKLAAMPVFTDALLADTLDLSAEEFGAYCLILFMTWEKGARPFADDDRILSRIARVPLRQWRSTMRARLAPFFDLGEGTWNQKRLEKEWSYTLTNRAQKSLAGKASAEAKRLKNQETGPTVVSTEGPTAGQRRGNPSTSTSTSLREGSSNTPLFPDGSENQTLSDSVDSDFAIWWEHVPNKKAKDGALTCYRRARKKATAQALLAGIQRYAASVAGKDKKYIAHPTTWLNEGRWKDEEAVASEPAIDLSAERLARLKAKYGVKCA